MGIVYFLVLLFILLILYTMISTIIKLSLYLTTRVKYENIRLVVPFILSIVVWFIVVSLCIFTLNKYIEGNIFSKIIQTYIKKESLLPILKSTFIFSFIYLLIGIILQSLTYLSANIKLENVFSYIRYYIFKLFKLLKIKLNLKNKPKLENIIEKEPVEDITLGKAFISSMFSTILIIFFVTIFILIGFAIATNINI